MGCVLLASQPMTAICQMAASVSDSEMPTAIKAFLSENKSFYSGPMWRSEPQGLSLFEEPGFRGKQMERTVRRDRPLRKGEE